MKRTFALLSLAATLATAATVAYALPQYSYHFTFYSDSSHTTVVGEGFRDCRNGWHIYWGEKTANMVGTEQELCS